MRDRKRTLPKRAGVSRKRPRTDCGLPLTWPTGEIFGTICILDQKENAFNHRIHPLLERFRDSTERKRAAAELQQQLEELRRWQTVMLGTSDRSMKLKCEVNDLLRRLGEPVRYPTQQKEAGGSGEVIE